MSQKLELEKLNTATSEINNLELELDESNTTFRMLLNEATRRLKGLAQRLGSSVDKARPYHEAAAAAASARAACQRAAVAYQRANEIHAAAKETVLLAEQRFKSNQHEWQFDNAWQEMLNHATIKVMDAENQKAESGREHHKKAQLFNAAETKLLQLDEQLRKHIIKSRPYFEEKQLCQEQLATQKARIEALQAGLARCKLRYSASLRALEAISEEIHRKRKEAFQDWPVGPREPGVGAERDTDYSLELERNDLGLRNSGHSSPGGGGAAEGEEPGGSEDLGGLEELRRRVRRLAARPVEGGASDTAWETELNETVNRLDQMLMMRERAQQARSISRDESPQDTIRAGPGGHDDGGKSLDVDSGSTFSLKEKDASPSRVVTGSPYLTSSPRSRSSEDQPSPSLLRKPAATPSSGKQAFQTLYALNRDENISPQFDARDRVAGGSSSFVPFDPSDRGVSQEGNDKERNLDGAVGGSAGDFVSSPERRKLKIQELSIDNLKLASYKMSVEADEARKIYIPFGRTVDQDQAGSNVSTFQMDSPDFSYDIRFDADFGRTNMSDDVKVSLGNIVDGISIESKAGEANDGEASHLKSDDNVSQDNRRASTEIVKDIVETILSNIGNDDGSDARTKLPRAADGHKENNRDVSSAETIIQSENEFSPVTEVHHDV